MSSTTDGTSNPDAEKFNYQSKERDSESGYDYFEARLYDSATGRFLQVDPLAHRFIDMNAYMGMNGNPISMYDPDGRAAQGPGVYDPKKNSTRKQTANDQLTKTEIHTEFNRVAAVFVDQYNANKNTGTRINSKSSSIGYWFRVKADDATTDNDGFGFGPDFNSRPEGTRMPVYGDLGGTSSYAMRLKIAYNVETLEFMIDTKLNLAGDRVKQGYLQIADNIRTEKGKDNKLTLSFESSTKSAFTNRLGKNNLQSGTNFQIRGTMEAITEYFDNLGYDFSVDSNGKATISKRKDEENNEEENNEDENN